jgi:membrane fusion protein (multidrug efflux system)
MKNRLVVVTLAAAIALVLPACQTGEASLETDQPEAAPPLPVEVAMPRITDIYATYQTTAALTADQAALIPARVAGEVVEILVEEGEPVVAGQPLARLDGDRLRLEMMEAKARLEMTKREYERSRRLRERGLVSASAAETLKFELDALRATYELKRLNYEYTTIKATIPGVITNRHIKVGWRIDEGLPAFEIADTDRLVAELHIPQTALARISAGQDARIAVDALPRSDFHATIERISPTIDAADGSFRATVYIDNRQRLLAPGMFGRFVIAYEEHIGALVIPSSALVREDNEDVVYIVQDGAALRRPVTVGIESDGMTEILDGLGGNEPVVVTGQGSLRDGSKVLASNELGIAG